MGKHIKKMKAVSVCLLVGMMMLLVTQSMAPVVVADYSVPTNIQRGDVVLTKWADRSLMPAGLWFHYFLSWDHSMLYTGNIGGTNRIIHAWNGVQNLTWNDGMEYNDNFGGVGNLGIVRFTIDQDIRHDAIKFAESKVGSSYDSASQSVVDPRKQIQETVEDWWDDVFSSNWINRFSYNVGGRAEKYYCHEIIWAAYLDATEGDLNIEFTADGLAIRGMEMWLDSDGSQINPTPYNAGNPSPKLYDECS